MVHAMSDDPHAASARLDPLRRELGQIDREILALVARRQAIAQRIGQVKRDAGITTRDFRQEKDVVERARTAAVAHGLSAKLGEELLLALIRGSLEVQEKDTVAATGEGNGRRALMTRGKSYLQERSRR
jgi:chorismate mutase